MLLISFSFCRESVGRLEGPGCQGAGEDDGRGTSQCELCGLRAPGDPSLPGQNRREEVFGARVETDAGRVPRGPPLIVAHIMN